MTSNQQTINYEAVTVTDIFENSVEVAASLSASCNGCDSDGKCGQQSWFSMQKSGRMRIPASTAEINQLHVGQQIYLSLPEGAVALNALLLYGIPLLGCVAGAFIVPILFFGVLVSLFNLEMGLDPELLTAVGAIMGLLVGFLLAKSLLKNRFQTYIPKLCLSIAHNH